DRNVTGVQTCALPILGHLFQIGCESLLSVTDQLNYAVRQIDHQNPSGYDALFPEDIPQSDLLAVHIDSAYIAADNGIITFLINISEERRVGKYRSSQ